jgi:hypothetical protein
LEDARAVEALQDLGQVGFWNQGRGCDLVGGLRRWCLIGEINHGAQGVFDRLREHENFLGLQYWILTSDFDFVTLSKIGCIYPIFMKRRLIVNRQLRETSVIHVNEQRLETDLGYRFEYLSEFMGFGAEDVEAIHASAPALAGHVPSLVDAVYTKLRRYDATWRHFLPRQQGYEGALPKSLDDLTEDHEIIRYRKEHLSRYLVGLVTKPYDGKMVAYLDMVGKMHTTKAGASGVVVPLVQMNALLGFVADALNQTILSLGLEREQEVKTLRAFSKLLWVQNDLINRHYQESAAIASVA